MWIGGVLVGLAVLLLALNRTSLPLKLAREFVGVVQARTGVTIELSAATFVGPAHLRLEGVTFATDEGIVSHGEAAQVHVHFNPWRALRGGGDHEALGAVHVVRPRLFLREAALPSRPRVSDAALPSQSKPKGDVDAKPFHVRVHVRDGVIEEPPQVARFGREWRIQGDLDLAVGSTVAIIPRRIYAEQPESDVSVWLASEGEARPDAVSWAVEGPASALLRYLPSVSWTMEGSLKAQGETTLSDGQSAVALTLTDGEGVVRAEGAFIPGERGRQGSLDLTVVAEGLELPAGVDLLEQYGFRGKSNFTGVLAGTLDELELSGRLKLWDGLVWNRPVDFGEGVISLKNGSFRFGQTELVRGDAQYQLSGEVESGASPARVRVDLAADGGDVKEVLAVAGIDVEAEGEFDGHIRYSSVGEIPSVEGRIARGRGSVMGQTIDSVQGNFMWSNEAVRIADAEVRLDGGALQGAGQAVGESLNFDVRLVEWPLAQKADSPLALGADVAGWVSFHGAVTGTLDAPALVGEVTDGRIQAGRLALANPQGWLEVRDDRVRLDGMRLVSAGQGVYTLTGVIDGWRSESPELALNVGVSQASLSGLLSEGGLSLPALLLDGDVSGNIELSGEASDLSARFDLALSDPWSVGEPIPLRFQFADGRLKLDRSIFGLAMAR